MAPEEILVPQSPGDADGASSKGAPSPPGPPAEPRGSRRRKLLRRTFWIVLALEVVAWMLLRGVGERWWLVTLLALGPRWMLALPVLALTPAAAWVRPRRLLAVWALSAAITALPVMGF